MSGQQDPNRPTWLRLHIKPSRFTFYIISDPTPQWEVEYRRQCELLRSSAEAYNPIPIDDDDFDKAALLAFCENASKACKNMLRIMEEAGRIGNNGAGAENEANADPQNAEVGSAQQAKRAKLEDSASASNLSINQCGMNYARTNILGHLVSYCADDPSAAMRSERNWALIWSSDNATQNTWKSTDFLKINHRDYAEFIMHGVSVLVTPKEGKTQEQIHAVKGPNGELGLVLPE